MGYRLWFWGSGFKVRSLGFRGLGLGFELDYRM
jgi:hypothetical protein